MSSNVMKINRRRFMEAAGITTAALLSGLPMARAAESSGRKMKIGVIGTGNVGTALGRTWVASGHQVMFASRSLEEDQALAAELGAKASAGTPREAAAFGEVVVFAVPYRALPELGKSLEDIIKGKVVIDACNPFPSRDGEIAEWAREKGAGVASAELLPGARIVRAFNAVGAARMGSAHQRPGQFGMPIAGNDAQAIAVASQLVREIGYEPILIGDLARGRHLVPGTPLAGEHPPQEVRETAAKL